MKQLFPKLFRVGCLAACLSLFALSGHAAEGVKNLSLRNEVDQVIHQTLPQLAQEQTLDGYWRANGVIP